MFPKRTLNDLKLAISIITLLCIDSCKISKETRHNPDRKISYEIKEIKNSIDSATVYGTIEDQEDKGPFPLSTVLLKQDGKITSGAFIDSSGHFKFEKLKAGNYKLQITSTYFKTEELKIEIKPYSEYEIKISILPNLIMYIDKNND